MVVPRGYRKKDSSVGLAGNDQCLHLFVYVPDSDIVIHSPCPGFGPQGRYYSRSRGNRLQVGLSCLRLPPSFFRCHPQ